MPVWARRKAEVERLETELAEQIERADGAEADREALRAASDHVHEELVAADQRAQQLIAAHAEVTAGLTKRAELAESQVAQLRGQLTTKGAELATAQAAVDELRTTLAGMQTSLDNSRGELTTARDVLGGERDQARQQLATVREQAQRAEADHAVQIQALTRRVEEAASRAEELASHLQQADAEVLSTRREAERVQGLLEERTDEARAATARAAVMAEQMTELTGQLQATQQQPTEPSPVQIDAEAPAPRPKPTSRPDQPTEPEQPPPTTDSTTDSTTDQPGRSRSPQRQQPSRRRRGRPAKG
jgi:chromosome segregation ATPase